MHRLSIWRARLNSLRLVLPVQFAFGLVPSSPLRSIYEMASSFRVSSSVGAGGNYDSRTYQIEGQLLGQRNLKAEASVHKIEGHAFVSVQKSYKAPIVRRGHIIVDSTVIPMIGNVQRIDPEPEMMSSTTLAFEEGYTERAIRLEVE